MHYLYDKIKAQLQEYNAFVLYFRKNMSTKSELCMAFAGIKFTL